MPKFNVGNFIAQAFWQCILRPISKSRQVTKMK